MSPIQRPQAIVVARLKWRARGDEHVQGEQLPIGSLCCMIGKPRFDATSG